MMAISESDRLAYRRDGAIVLRGVLDASWVERMRRAVDEVVAAGRVTAYGADRGEGQGRFYGGVFMWTWHEDFRALAFESGAAAAAGGLMGASDVRLFKDHLFVKQAGADDPTPWHQDLPYWCVEGDQVCSLWMPFDRVAADNGGIEFVRGSHRWNKRFDIEGFGGGMAQRQAGLEKIPDIDAARGDYDILSWDLEPGDAVAFHALTIHGAPGNRSDRGRRVLSLRVVGEDAVYNPHAAASKPHREPACRPGERLDPEVFPLLWHRREEAVPAV